LIQGGLKMGEYRIKKFWMVPPSRYLYKKSILSWESQLFTLNFRQVMIPFTGILLSLIILFLLPSPLWQYGGLYYSSSNFYIKKPTVRLGVNKIRFEKNNKIYINYSRLHKLEHFIQMVEDGCDEAISYDNYGRPVVALEINTEVSWGFIVEIMDQLRKMGVKTVWLTERNTIYYYGDFIINRK